MQTLKQDGEFVLSRGSLHELLDDLASGAPYDDPTASILVLAASAEPPSANSRHKLEHELALASELDRSFAARPLKLIRRAGRTVLLLEDPGGEPLEQRIGGACEVGEFLSLAIAITTAVARAHARGLIHKDLKPANILLNVDGQAFLTGFGIASRSPRERQVPQPPAVLAGTLPYMAPEQTGRMNRSIDSRSDLYALGITLFELLTGRLPFTATDPMDWVHCHIARRPPSARQYHPLVPEPVAQILLKLLAKSAEERYQTAAGLQADLRRCLEQWRRSNGVEAFALGETDAPDRLVTPERLYGRERELAALRSAYDQVATRGLPVLFLVAGYAGVGKSAIVHEFRQELLQGPCWFAAGKCDSSHREIPYITLMKAFGSLARQLLGRPDSEIAQWRSRLLEALGGNGQLLVDLIPELELIIGRQAAAPQVPPQDALHRFRRVLRRFVGVFGTAELPLVLFLDDLQWSDVATIDLLEHLLTHPDLRHLLVIGAYRDHEVGAAHPLAPSLEVLCSCGTIVEQMPLKPLQRSDVERLVCDALHCPRERVAELANLVHLKTDGNPFFALQFLANLEQEALLKWDSTAGGWSWDLARIRTKGLTDNVAHLLVGRLSRLSPNTVAALQCLACIGGGADVDTLAAVLDASAAAVHRALEEAAFAGLVIRSEGTYRLLHDRIQEAAYSLITKQDRPTLHLRIGRALRSRMSPQELDENIFQIVNHFNRSRELIADADERQSVAELNLRAARQAVHSSAYSAANNFLVAGTDLLPRDRWTISQASAFGLELTWAECELQTGQPQAAAVRLGELAARACNPTQGAAVACLRQMTYETLGNNVRTVEVCLEFLAQQGVVLPSAPTEEAVREEYARLWRQLGTRPVEELIDLSPVTDPRQRAILDVLASVLAPIFLTSNANLFRLVVGRMANLSLAHGNSDGSVLAYSYLNFIVGAEYGDYALGFRFGKLAVDLLDKGLFRFRARVELMFGATVIPWTQPMRSGLVWLRRSLQSAQEAGDLTLACYAWFMLLPHSLCAGEPLAEVHQEGERALEFARKHGSYMLDLITPQMAFVRALRGGTAALSSLTTADFDEGNYEKRLGEQPALDDRVTWYWIRKLQLYFHADDYPAALKAASHISLHLWRALTLFEISSDYHFYTALSRAAYSSDLCGAELRQQLDAIVVHLQSLEAMAAGSAANFRSRASLVGAELARLERRDAAAQRLYEQAICAATDHHLIHDEAVALESAAGFYLSRGLSRLSHGLLTSARSCYQQWGALAKVRHLDAKHPHLRESFSPPVGALGAFAGELEASAVIEAARSVSSEIVLENLVELLLTLAMKQAGADRGKLILARGDTARLEATATTEQNTVSVTVRQQDLTAEELPLTVVNYVMRTHESVILDDVATSDSFRGDDYLQRRRPRSLSCQSLTRQGRLIGVLYLENTIAAGAFTAARAAVLNVLGAQAAISLENAYLYSDLRASESRTRRLIDSNIVGVFFWSRDGAITDANEAFLRLVGHSVEDLRRGTLSWRQMNPPEYLELNQLISERMFSHGMCTPHERELLHRNGTRVPVLIGATFLERSREHGLSFVLDLSAAKRTEAEARENERRYREVEAVLAHANRLATMGQFTASIAHEVGQPLTAMRLNASTGIKSLESEPPDLYEARNALNWILKDSYRAGDIVSRIREHIKNAPPRTETLDVNDAISEVIALARSEVDKQEVRVVTRLAPDLCPVQGDRVQLQQVVLNLMLNALEAMSAVDAHARELSISTDRSARQEILVIVRDSGPGIRSEDLERVFESFYTTKVDGLGIGLSICRSIIDAHGGRLWAEANESQGATFKFSLPTLERPDNT